MAGIERDELLAKAEVIRNRVNDSEGSLGFHIMAIKKLGFEQCYKFTSEGLELLHGGRIKKSLGRYYNNRVMTEIHRREEYAKKA